MRTLPALPTTAFLVALAWLGACQSSRASQPEPAPVQGAAPVPVRPSQGLPAGEAGRLLQLARDHNSTLGQARARVDAARAELAQAESVLRPRLSFDAALTAADSPSLYLFKAIDAHELDANTDFNHPGSFESTEAGLTLRWNLWNGGRDQLAREGSEATLQAREAELAAVANNLSDAVLAAWIAIGVARELEQADESSVAALRAGVETEARRVAAGSALRAEQLSLEVRLAEAQERLESAHLARRLAVASLRQLCGVDAAGSLGADESVLCADAPATLEAAQSEALAGRAELRALERAIASAEKHVEAQQRSGLPSLDLEGRVYATELEIDPALDQPNSSLMLGLHWDLTDGGARRARRSAAQAALRELEEQRRGREESIVLEVESAWWQLGHARVQLELAQTGLHAAEETFTLVEAQQREGSATVSRFLEVEADRAEARARRVRARLGLVRSQAALAAALGRWSR